ncbi:hypothetical protein, partial [Tritonibacter sp. SIMBA_163]|uniref:hypothetical protein n=1 Tax=Tritonibacter sp. SIMBA_163 TaxID=3080868 RepID=UPI00397F8F5A
PRRTADVVSVGFNRLLTLGRKEFKRLEKADPEIGRLIREAGEARLPGADATGVETSDPQPANA